MANNFVCVYNQYINTVLPVWSFWVPFVALKMWSVMNPGSLDQPPLYSVVIIVIQATTLKPNSEPDDYIAFDNLK